MENLKLYLGLFLYKIAPIKKNRYVFTSLNGHYSDNTRAISEKFHEMHQDAEIIWLVSSEYKKDVPSYAKTVDIASLKSYWYRGTAAAQVDNVYGFRSFFKMDQSRSTELKGKIWNFLTNKKKQPIFSTFHATPIKKLGRDQVGNAVYGMICPNSYLIVGDQLTADILKRVTFGVMPVEVIGSPRNDILYGAKPTAKKELGLPENKKIILYAPTFRNDGKDVEGKNVRRSGLDQIAEMDFDLLFQTLSQKFGDEWVLVCRFHYHVSGMVNWKELDEKYPGKIINGNKHDDMAQYLSCTDVLVTDSSSCMVDFSLTGKPCFIYFPDLDHYRDKERGFYLDINELPFPSCVKFSDLIYNIENFDSCEYKKNVALFLEKIGSKNDGEASGRAVECILNKTKYR